MEDLFWLMDWFGRNGAGETKPGFRVFAAGTLEWNLEIPLGGTALHNRPFAIIQHNDESAVSWWQCQVDHGFFHGSCGVRDLPAILTIFREWAAGT
jgi:hypothetical protein